MQGRSGVILALTCEIRFSGMMLSIWRRGVGTGSVAPTQTTPIFSQKRLVMCACRVCACVAAGEVGGGGVWCLVYATPMISQKDWSCVLSICVWGEGGRGGTGIMPHE